MAHRTYNSTHTTGNSAFTDSHRNPQHQRDTGPLNHVPHELHSIDSIERKMFPFCEDIQIDKRWRNDEMEMMS